MYDFFFRLPQKRRSLRSPIMMDGSKQINKKAAAIQERIYSLE
jgi:hypothetical protein